MKSKNLVTTLLIAGFLFLLIGGNASAAENDSARKISTIAGQIALGSATYFAGYGVSAFIVVNPLGAPFIVGTAMGSVSGILASAQTVQFVGNTRGYRGRFHRTLIGGIGGVAIALGGALVMGGTDADLRSGLTLSVGWLLGTLLVPVVETWEYHRSADPSPPPDQALINVENGHVRIAIPTILPRVGESAQQTFAQIVYVARVMF
jgi:hypothetical protein